MDAARAAMNGRESQTIPVIECCEVSKTYESGTTAVRALDNVSLQVGPGTIIGLIGPNGAGKTTFLSLIAGLIFPTSGVIRVGGYPARSREARRSLGYIPESPAFLARYCARATLEYHAALHGLSRGASAAEVDRVLTQSGLQEYAGRAVGGFSLGMRQRLALAIALLDHPRLLLLDEPSNGLDPLGVIELRRVLLDVQRSGATIVISSHRLGELERLTSDYVFLHRGRIVQLGGTVPAGQTGRLRIEFLPGSLPVAEEMLTPYRPLERSEAGWVVGVDGVRDVPNVVRSLVGAGAQITGVALETQDIEQTFVRLYQEGDGA